MNSRDDREHREGSPLVARLLRAGAAVQARIEHALEPVGLSSAKLGLLRHLAGEGEGLPLARLAERLSCVRSNVTQLVDRLEADGLVRRTPDPGDRRSVLAVLTEKGRRSYETGERARAEAAREVLRALTGEERKQLAALLEKLGG